MQLKFSFTIVFYFWSCKVRANSTNPVPKKSELRLLIQEYIISVVLSTIDLSFRRVLVCWGVLFRLKPSKTEANCEARASIQKAIPTSESFSINFICSPHKTFFLIWYCLTLVWILCSIIGYAIRYLFDSSRRPTVFIFCNISPQQVNKWNRA